MSTRHYIDNTPTATLPSQIDNSQTSYAVSSLIGFPTSFPYTATHELGTSTAEQVLVTSAVGSTVTVTRNHNGLGAFSHTAQSTFQHTADAIDFTEANTHVNATDNVHGISGEFVDTNSTQTLNNKTLAGGSAALAATASVPAVAMTTDADSSVVWSVKNHSGSVVGKMLGSGALTANGATLGAATATTLSTSGVATLASASVTADAAVGGNLGVTGAATLASAGVTGNATVGGTLGVTGVTTLHVVNAGNTAITGTLSAGATGVTTLAASSDASIGGNATVTGTLTVGTEVLLPITYTDQSTTGLWTSSGTALTVGNAVIVSRYARNGRQVHWYGSISFGSSSAPGSGAWNLLFPITPTSLASTNGAFIGLSYVLQAVGLVPYASTAVAASTSSLRIINLANNTAIGVGNPFTWATGDRFTWNVWYEAAS